MVAKLPRGGLRQADIKKMLASGIHLKIIVVHEIMLDERFRMLIDCGTQRYTLYTYRGEVKRFASLAYIYKFCQSLGIPEFQVMVKINKDGV